ncbi:head GIN domain-containing protein [Henriciella aquimarina]|uniref:head GIN domain-containing protein n=1 Tax=Henriciella aquimarina TaxID=545261 RepID=UPI000A0621C8|nr:head GIN domain-containing protein [Henriciella aquimarina]
MPLRLTAIALATTSLAALPALAETRTYDVSAFDGIDVSAGIEVIYETGVTQSVVVENSKGDFDDIIVEVDDGDLVLKRPRKIGWGGRRTAYTVTVGAQALSEIEASSGSSVEGSGLSGEETSIDVSSGARAVITNISTGEIDIEASSGSNVEASGTCNELEAEASSGASIDASSLQCTSLSADVSSGASIRAYASERIDADASSGGSVRVDGGATDVTIDKSSGGSVSVG